MPEIGLPPEGTPFGMPSPGGIGTPNNPVGTTTTGGGTPIFPTDQENARLRQAELDRQIAYDKQYLAYLRQQAAANAGNMAMQASIQREIAATTARIQESEQAISRERLALDREKFAWQRRMDQAGLEANPRSLVQSLLMLGVNPAGLGTAFGGGLDTTSALGGLLGMGGGGPLASFTDGGDGVSYPTRPGTLTATSIAGGGTTYGQGPPVSTGVTEYARPASSPMANAFATGDRWNEYAQWLADRQATALWSQPENVANLQLADPTYTRERTAAENLASMRYDPQAMYQAYASGAWTPSDMVPVANARARLQTSPFWANPGGLAEGAIPRNPLFPFVSGRHLNPRQALSDLQTNHPRTGLISSLASFSGQDPGAFWGEFGQFLPRGGPVSLTSFR